MFAHFAEEYDPGCAKRGWQHEASSRVERRHREFFLSRLSENEQASLRSQSGPLAGAALMATLSHDATRIDPHLFRVFLLRRVAVHSIRLATTTCAVEQGFWQTGFVVESIGARICREGGARVSTNVHVRDLDILAPEVHDGCRIVGGAQFVVDTTLVSTHHCDGSARARAARVDGPADGRNAHTAVSWTQEQSKIGGVGRRGWTLVRRNFDFSPLLRGSTRLF